MSITIKNKEVQSKFLVKEEVLKLSKIIVNRKLVELENSLAAKSEENWEQKVRFAIEYLEIEEELFAIDKEGGVNENS